LARHVAAASHRPGRRHHVAGIRLAHPRRRAARPRQHPCPAADVTDAPTELIFHSADLPPPLSCSPTRPACRPTELLSHSAGLPPPLSCSPTRPACRPTELLSHSAGLPPPRILANNAHHETATRQDSPRRRTTRHPSRILMTNAHHQTAIHQDSPGGQPPCPRARGRAAWMLSASAAQRNGHSPAKRPQPSETATAQRNGDGPAKRRRGRPTAQWDGDGAAKRGWGLRRLRRTGVLRGCSTGTGAEAIGASERLGLGKFSECFRWRRRTHGLHFLDCGVSDCRLLRVTRWMHRAFWLVDMERQLRETFCDLDELGTSAVRMMSGVRRGIHIFSLSASQESINSPT
jgi:hypothetical protein